ncbi:50S ribosomal protein L30 [Candidatus Woesearchaeota archaeon]|nr:MAG: 50S ribosomal protein L30 [Candidatus Woesearchaeota archaeon]
MKIAAIRIRGLVKVNKEIKDTLTMLKLHKKHTCVVLEANDSVLGMLKKAKDYITFGPVNEETLKLLESKKSNRENVYHLHPPRGGFERGGIKKAYSAGGALGDRGEDINKLIQRMIS